MVKFRAETTIARSAEDIFAYAADVARHPEWMGVTDAKLISGHQTEVGARAAETLKFGPRTIPFTFEVVEVEPNRRIVWRTVDGGALNAEGGLQLVPEGPTSTRATYFGSMGLRGVWRLLEPLMAAEIRAGESAELERLKAKMESGADSHAGG